MIGLLTEQGKPLLRAYSITTPFWDEKIGFYSIKVADGPLTSRLQHIKPDEFIIMKRKPTGTLVLDALTLPAGCFWSQLAQALRRLRLSYVTLRPMSGLTKSTCFTGAGLQMS